MKSDGRDSHQKCELYAPSSWRVFLVFGGNHCRSSHLFALTKLEAARPNSERWPRSALTLIVRCLISSSRVLCSVSTAWFSALLTGTKRMAGRDLASAMAVA